MRPPEGEQPTSARRPVVLVALGILVADLVTKQIMLALVFDPPRRIEVTPFLNFVPVWNPGVSFGILADAGGAVPLFSWKPVAGAAGSTAGARPAPPACSSSKCESRHPAAQARALQGPRTLTRRWRRFATPLSR